MATEWTISEAAKQFSALSELAESYGFRLSMFGSTLLRGVGHDLDLLFSPIATLTKDRSGFLRAFGGTLKQVRFNPAHNVCAFQVEKEDRLYDLVFGGFWRGR